MLENINKVIIRNEYVEGLGPWVWVKDDIASWEIPKNEWVQLNYRKVILDHCSNHKVVVQAGGCQGMYPRLLSDMFEKVYTFEPHPLNFHVLVANCQKDNIIKINGALSHSCDTSVLIENKLINSGRHAIFDAPCRSITDETGNHYNIQLFTVDSLNLPSLDLLMLDVETYEHEALLGSVNTINKHKPVIICEGDDAKVTQLLNSLGYEKAHTFFSDTLYKYVK